MVVSKRKRYRTCYGKSAHNRHNPHLLRVNWTVCATKYLRFHWSKTTLHQAQRHANTEHLISSTKNSEWCSSTISKLLDDDGCVVAAEAKTIAHRVNDFARFWHVGRVVQIAIGIRRFQIDGWRHRVFLDRLDAED
jgi:hypothetical protein